jgi:hypothetical protein
VAQDAILLFRRALRARQTLSQDPGRLFLTTPLPFYPALRNEETCRSLSLKPEIDLPHYLLPL